MNLFEVEQTFGTNISMFVYKAYYKTKSCPIGDKCTHGINCYDVHNQEELRTPLCINFYNKKCNNTVCNRDHSFELVKLPDELFNVLVNRLNNFNLIKDKIEKKVSYKMDKEIDYQVHKIKENYRNKERSYEKEIDELKQSLKKRRRYENDDLNKINLLEKDNNELKEMNQYLISQIKQKDGLINDLISGIQYYNLQLLPNNNLNQTSNNNIQNINVSRNPYYNY
jgi:hypothetical protein